MNTQKIQSEINKEIEIEKRNLAKVFGIKIKHLLLLRDRLGLVFHSTLYREMNPLEDALCELYYFHVTAASRKPLRNRIDAILRVAGEHREMLEAELKHYEQAFPIFDKIDALKEAKKTAPKKRVASKQSTGYQFHRRVSEINRPLETGDTILVRFGNGTQPITVLDADPKRVTLKVARLWSRGTVNAYWRHATISRNDSRILGFHQLVTADPALVADRIL